MTSDNRGQEMDEVDVYAVMETTIWVDPEQADREELPCTYCTGAEWVWNERVRAEPHGECLVAVDNYMASVARGDM